MIFKFFCSHGFMAWHNHRAKALKQSGARGLWDLKLITKKKGECELADNKNKRMKRHSKGFTLVELVVVIAILGILVAIAVPRMGGSRKTAAINAHNANVRELQSAAMMYIADHGVPTTTPETWDGGKNQNWSDYLQDWPDIPTGAGVSAPSGKESYVVTIGTDGKVEVEPNTIPTTP